MLFVILLATASKSIPSTWFASPSIERSTALFLLNSVGSASIWIILAPGANSEKFPVERSENRTPTATRRSHSDTSLFASALPCIPIGPSESGWSSGKSPFPCSVVITGAMRSSARAANGCAASAILTPPPPQKMGLSALTIMAAARSTSWTSTGAFHL